MAYDVITIGGATEDINFYVNNYHLLANKENPAGNPLLAFDYGTKVDVRKVSMTFGGGAANTAVCFASFGLKTGGVITCGGDDRGREIIANLKKRRVDIRFMKRLINKISGFSFIIIGANNEHVAFSHRAANSFLEVTPRDMLSMRRAKWLFVTSFSGTWRHELVKIFSLGHEIKIAWNPGEMQINAGYRTLREYLKKTTVLTLNKDEAIKLVVSRHGSKVESYDFLANSENLLKIIYSWGPKIVVVTNGEHGADAYDGKDFYFQGIVKPKKKEDTTGLGDAFGASFVTGLINYDGDIKKSLWLAANNSASVLSKQGAQNGLLTKHDLPRIDRLYNKKKGSKKKK